MIAIDPRYASHPATPCRCLELDVTCDCGHTSGSFYINVPANSSGCTVLPFPFREATLRWRTPKFRPHGNFYAAPERFESQPVPIRVHLRTWLHRKPTRRATAKAVRNWRQQ